MKDLKVFGKTELANSSVSSDTDHLSSQDLFTITNQSRRTSTLRILNLGWALMGLVALSGVPFFQEERIQLLAMSLIAETTYFLIRYFNRRNTQFAGLLFSIVVAFAFLTFYLITSSQIGHEAALETQANILMMMGLAIIFSGAIVGKRAAIAFSFINSVCLAALFILAGRQADPRISVHVFWWLLALTIWLYEVNLEGAFARLKIVNERLEDLVGLRTSDLQRTVVSLELAHSNLERSNQELRILSQVKDEFISNVSHELRTPLTSLKLNEYLIRQNPDKIEVYTGRMERETVRLELIIEDLLRLSRLDQDRTLFTSQLADLNNLTEVFVNDRLPLAEQKNILLTHHKTPNLPECNIDVGLMEQVLSIFVTNALNYTPSGGKIIVSTCQKEIAKQEFVGFSVSDTGPGISERDREQLFTRFFRGEAGRTSGVPGTGLGLPIASEIVQRHHGLIEVESGIDGKGTSFRVMLPIPISAS